jgi:hypothetical protein
MDLAHSTTISTTFMEHLAQVPDPRCPRSQRFEWRILLAIITAGLASGQQSPGAITDWMQAHAAELLAQLQPAKGRLPSRTTLWRVLNQVSRQAVEQQVAAHNQSVDRAEAVATRVAAVNGAALQGQALDGKAVRGASAHSIPTFLVSLVHVGVIPPGVRPPAPCPYQSI